MPFSAFLFFAAFVLPGICRRQGNIGYCFTAWHVTHFRILAQITDQNCLVHRCHFTLLVKVVLPLPHQTHACPPLDTPYFPLPPRLPRAPRESAQDVAATGLRLRHPFPANDTTWCAAPPAVASRLRPPATITATPSRIQTRRCRLHTASTRRPPSRQKMRQGIVRCYTRPLPFLWRPTVQQC